MKISHLLSVGTTISLEFAPPRTPAREEELAITLKQFESLNPSFVSITYGAGGSTRTRTHDLVRQMMESSMLPMAHLTCIAHDRDELVAILSRYRDEGLENILALRGDPPIGADETFIPSPFKYATELVDLSRSVGDFCVAVAMHPEGHPKAQSLEQDRAHQARKLRDADFGITQFFFSVSDYTNFVQDMRSRGAEQPIIPGVLPPTSLNQLDRLAELSGAQVPSFVREVLSANGNESDAVRAAGIRFATQLCDELLSAGAPGLHFYTMNRAHSTLEVLNNLDKLGLNKWPN